MKNISRLFKYLKPFWFKAVMNFIFNILSIIFSLFSIFMAIRFLGILFGTEPPVREIAPFEYSVDWLQQYLKYYLTLVVDMKGPEKALLLLSFFMIITSFFRNVTRYLALYFLTPLRNGIVRNLRNSIFSKTLELPLRFFNKSRKGDLIARMTGDVQEIEWSIISSLEMLFRDPITIICYLVVLFLMSYQLTLFVFILLPISGFIMGRIGKSLKKSSFKAQQKMGFLLSIIEETLGGMRIIKAFNAEIKVDSRFINENEKYTSIMNRVYWRRFLANPVSEFLGTAVLVIIMYYGGTLVLGDSSSMKPQDLIGYLLLFYLIIAPAKSFSSAYYNIQKGLASLDRIDLILNKENEIYESKNPVCINEFKDFIEYKNVTFKYEDEVVLKNVNLKIQKGKTIALVGHSGSGKSTMVDLLPRFYDIQEGDILIDGISIKDYKIKDLRSLMGIVNQESILFNDTFYNNIAFGLDCTSLEKVEKASKVANAHEFIESTENGYNSNIGDRGSQISGGQRQRVSIARAVLKNPPIMILDEATSALDTESEKLVQEAIENLMKNRTSVVIAHRLSTVKRADEICVLHEGEIVERGKHDELLALNGIYTRLHALQMQ